MNKQKVKINGERLKNALEKFADFGRTKNNGVTRLALTEEDRLARDYLRSCFEELGLTVKVDDIGNMYGTLEGAENKPPIVIGSHMDTVKKGGRFDGILGVLAGLEIVRTLVDNNIKPNIPITVMNVTNEEGARFEPSLMSSGVLSGKFNKEAMFKSTDTDGITFGEALGSIGYAGSEENRLKEATAFLELHIEQGPILEREQLSIGVVDCVLGMVCYDIEVRGESNHAGTTPMGMRQDALFAANNVISEIRNKLSDIDDQLVYTMGRVNVAPNIHTVIPNQVVFSLEARHTDREVIKKVEQVIHQLPKSEGVLQEGCEARVNKLWERDTVWFDKELCRLFEQSARELGYSYKRMVSGAGHDAQFLQSYIPSAMVFVPSINGKSHVESELTKWEDCEKGANVLLETVLSMIS